MGLAIAAGLVAIGVTLVQALSALASIPAARRFEEALRGGELPGDVLTWYDATILLLIPALLVSYVITGLWLQAARSNAEAIRPRRRHQRGPVWVWLGWWVPIVSLWFPYQVVRDVQAGSGGGPRVSLGPWWTGWIIWLIMNRISSNVASSTDPDVVAGLPVAEAVGTAALVLACVQWCRLLRQITGTQEAALRR